MANFTTLMPLTGLTSATNQTAFADAVAPSLRSIRLPLPKWYMPALFCVFVTSTALPHGQKRVSWTMPVVMSLLSMLFYHSKGTFREDFHTGNMILGWFLVYLCYMLGKPEAERWKKDGRDLSPEERYKEINAKSFVSKLIWSLQVWTNPRGVGWSHQAPGLRKAIRDGDSKWKFVASQLSYYVLMLVISDALHLWYWSFKWADPAWNVYASPLPLQILIGASNRIRIYSDLAAGHALASGLTVALDFYQPNDWPPIVGNVADAYSLKRFWGLVWHQYMRQVAQAGGNVFAKGLLNLPKGTQAFRLAYLVGAFSATGLYHTLVDVWAAGFTSLDPIGDMRFFVSQGVMIWLEGLVLAYAKRRWNLKFNMFWRCVGYLWFFAWIGASQIHYMENMRRYGLWEKELKLLKYVPGLDQTYPPWMAA